MVKEQLFIPFLLFLVITVISFPGIIFAQSSESDNTLVAEETPEIVTEELDKINPYLSPDSMLVYGILIAAAATVSGIFITVADRKAAAQNKLQELMKLYSDEIREISDKEGELDTKQACSLYTEQYLDTLEQIATLKSQNIFKD